MSEFDTEWLQFLQRAVRHEDRATRLLTQIDQVLASAGREAKAYVNGSDYKLALGIAMDIQETPEVSHNSF